jgi:hypothetical protein
MRTSGRPRDRSTEAPAAADSGARAAVDRLAKRELELALLRCHVQRELIAAKAKRGRQVLQATDPAAVATEINAGIRTLEDEAATLGEAAGEAHAARVVAIPAAFEAEAADKEREAARLDADADKLEAESRRLRKPLEDHDGWGYVPAEGFVDGEYHRVVPPPSGPFRVVTTWGPRYQRARTEATALRAQAVQARQRKPHDAGMVEADSVEALLTAVLSDPMRVGPTVDAIVEWAEAARDRELWKRSRLSDTGSVGPDAAMRYRYRLQWQRANIDLSESAVFVPGLDPDAMAQIG